MANVTTQEEFKAAVLANDPSIFVENDIILTTPTNIPYDVTITGAEGVSLFWAPQSPTNIDMLVVPTTGNLTVNSLIIDAQNRDGTLVQINGGTLTVNSGTVLKGVKSTTDHKAVKIGNSSSPIGGTFIMNGGLITENEGSEVVFCHAGTVIMNNDASISGNIGAGITVSSTFSQPITGGRLVMTGQSIISNNMAKQSGGGCIIFGSDLTMGENEGDSPAITGNNTPYYGGGVVAISSTITMGYGAEVSNNYASEFGGGIVAQESNVSMRDSASIKNNKAEENVGGIAVIASGFTLSLEDNAEVSGNECVTSGGGIFISRGASLIIKDSASVYGNKAAVGGGISLVSSSATIGLDNSSPSIYNNTAANFGGGILVSTESTLNLTGHTSIYGNTADKGKGIYKMGDIYFSRMPKITDGLFFEDLSVMMAAYSLFSSQSPAPAPIPPLVVGDLEITIEPFLDEMSGSLLTAQSNGDYQETVCGNEPFIADVLIHGANIHLEESSHVTPPKTPLVIGEKADSYECLCEADRAGWQIPSNFGPGYTVILNEGLNRVLIDEETYNITYYQLYGADNPNPGTYSISSQFPIVLSEPGKREGYDFICWCDSQGNPITEITADTIGEIVLIAIWKEKEVYCITYLHLCGAENPNPTSYCADSKFPIWLKPPGIREGYIFTGWYDSQGCLVTKIPAGTTGDIVLVAGWKELLAACICFDGNAPWVRNIPASVYGEPGECVLIPDCIPLKQGHCFMGWNVKPLGTDKDYLPNDTIRLECGKVILYALWKPLVGRRQKDAPYCPKKKKC